MSLQYNPDENAQLDEIWRVSFLSDRDFSSEVPINYITRPGVHLTAACFENGVYDNQPTEKCLSNLIAFQYRRFVVDLYWDPGVRQFNLCPLRMPAALVNGTVTVDSAFIPPFTHRVAKDAVPNKTIRLDKKQQSNSSSILTNPTLTSASPTSATLAAPVATVTGQGGSTLYQLEQYSCSPSLNVDSILSLFGDYFDQTGEAIEDRILFLQVNLHAASLGGTSETGPAVIDEELPTDSESLAARFRAVFDNRLYTPAMLQSERANLNESWFRSTDRIPDPAVQYFDLYRTDSGNFATTNGWPGEDYLLFSSSRRILANWGRIDPQLSSYDFESDQGTIFADIELVVDHDIEYNNFGQLTSGCFFSSSEPSLADANYSFTLTTLNDVRSDVLPFLVNNLTACGISATLNTTLDNAVPLLNNGSYAIFAKTAIFSWAFGEPRNITADTFADPGSRRQHRCAVIDSTDGYRGHWRLEDCQKRYRAACRVDGNPHRWTISRDHVQYGAGPDACTDNTTFAAPRTGVENNYLYNHIRDEVARSNKPDVSSLSGIWVNVNSLHIESCWVTSGPNGTCPYYDDPDAIARRQVLVPTTAALIVLVLTVLTLFVKCGNNRRNSKQRKRGEGGWDYEGVPS